MTDEKEKYAMRVSFFIIKDKKGKNKESKLIKQKKLPRRSSY